MQPRFKTEQDLLMLIGQPESSRLEFKSSDLLKKAKDEVIGDLSRLVSAFANSEGGDIIVGVIEKRQGKARVAADLDDGIDLTEISPEWLQQIIESNVSPYLPGIRVRPIHLRDQGERAALVVSVPQGSTAYQAVDRRYYARSEFEVRALPDHEIRLRMMRGHVPQAQIEVVDFEVLTADREFVRREKELQAIETRGRGLRQTEKGGRVPIGVLRNLSAREKKLQETPKRLFDEYSFRVGVVNSGEVTLCDFLLVITASTDFELAAPTQGSIQTGSELRFRFAEGTSRGDEYSPAEKKIFPGDRVSFPADSWFIRVPGGTSIRSGVVLLGWKIYLDNAPPICGEINLAECSWSRARQ